MEKALLRWLLFFALALAAFQAEAGITGLEFEDGGNPFYHLAPPATIVASRNFDNGVSFSIQDSNGLPQNWSLDFAAPDNVPLAVGVYDPLQTDMTSGFQVRYLAGTTTLSTGTVPGTPNYFYKPSLFGGHDYKH